MKANPDTAKAWFEDKANVSGATLADAKAATPFLAIPVSSLSPRMATLDAKLKDELAVKLAFDAKVLRDSFPDPKPAFWNPDDSPALPSAFAYGHAARSLLPLDMGGIDRGSPGVRLYDMYRFEQIPPRALRLPGEFDRLLLAQQRLRAIAATALSISFIEPPNPRERIQRGQFQDAATDLVAKQEMFASGLERLRLNKDADTRIKEWIAAAPELYDDLGRAQLNNDKAAEATALVQLENHWKHPGRNTSSTVLLPKWV